MKNKEEVSEEEKDTEEPKSESVDDDCLNDDPSNVVVDSEESSEKSEEEITVDSLSELEVQLEEMKDQVLRHQAEVQNVKRRAEQDVEKARYHFEIAAMGGHENARHGLGGIEEGLGNAKKGMKHIMYAARCGYDMSMKSIGEAYKVGYVTKDEYASTLRAYQNSIDEMKSEQREAAKLQRSKSIDLRYI